MTAYVIAEISPQLSVPEYKQLMQQYSLAAAKTVKQYNGEFLAKAPSETLCGPTSNTMKVIITFPTTTQAKKWYQSEDYQALIAIRDKAMNCRFVLIEGN